MGSGYKSWSAGDVLNAADVMDYLMDQSVMSFADSTARDSALSGVLAEGMIAYLQDTNTLTFYTGSAWANVSTAGGTVAVANGGTGSTTASGARTNLGVAIGSDVQAHDADLDTIAGLAKTDGNFIVGNGSAWVAESGATARSSLGVAIGSDVQAWDADLDTIAAVPVAGTSWTPTWTGLTVGNGTQSSRYMLFPTHALCVVTLVLGSTSSVSTNTYVDDPPGMTISGSQLNSIVGGVKYVVNGNTFTGPVLADNSGRVELALYTAGGTYTGAAGLSNVKPDAGGWASGDTINASFWLMRET